MRFFFFQLIFLLLATIDGYCCHFMHPAVPPYTCPLHPQKRHHSNSSRISGISLKFVGVLTHWGRVTHICVGKLSIIGSDNGLSPGRRQAIIWTNAGMLLIGPLGTNFSEILIEILTFSFKKMRVEVSSAKWRPFCLGLNVLIPWSRSRLKMAIFFQFVCIPQFHWDLFLRVQLTISQIGSGNGLVPSGNKPLPEPMLTQIYVAIWRHQATMS